MSLNGSLVKEIIIIHPWILVFSFWRCHIFTFTGWWYDATSFRPVLLLMVGCSFLFLYLGMELLAFELLLVFLVLICLYFLAVLTIFDISKFVLVV